MPFVGFTPPQARRIETAVRGFEAARLAGKRGGPQRPLPQALPVIIRNDTGKALVAGEVVGLGDPVVLPSEDIERFRSQIAFRGEVPEVSSDRGQFAVLLAPCAIADYAPACASGVCEVQVYVPEGGDQYGFADVTDQVTGYLTSARSGSAEILWMPEGAGMHWAIVRIGTAYEGLIPFELYDDIQPGGSASVYPMLPDLSDADTEAETFTVYDTILRDVRAYGRNHTGFASGARGWCQVADNGHLVIVACQRLSKRCKAVTTAGVHASDSTFGVHQVVPLDDGQSPVASTSETLTVSNWAGWRADTSGRECDIEPDGAAGWRHAFGGCWPAPA